MVRNRFSKKYKSFDWIFKRKKKRQNVREKRGERRPKNQTAGLKIATESGWFCFVLLLFSFGDFLFLFFSFLFFAFFLAEFYRVFRGSCYVAGSRVSMTADQRRNEENKEKNAPKKEENEITPRDEKNK